MNPSQVYMCSTSLVLFFFSLSKKIRFCIISRVTVRKKVVTKKATATVLGACRHHSYKHSITLGSLWTCSPLCTQHPIKMLRAPVQ